MSVVEEYDEYGPRLKPKRLSTYRWRMTARRMRDSQWLFMERAVARGTLWFCTWNRSRREEKPDEIRCSLIGGDTYSQWIRCHPDWFVVGEWDHAREAFPVQVTDAGRAALADRAPYDHEPIEGGMVDPGWDAIPFPPRKRRN
jgi:hypothetical protein